VILGAHDVTGSIQRVYERNKPRPWSFDGSSAFSGRMLAQIVGFKIEIEKIEGKWKLNQNHPVERRKRVVRALGKRGDENAQAMAALMQAMLSGSLFPNAVNLFAKFFHEFAIESLEENEHIVNPFVF
jgi:hypothetical protein